MISLQREPSLGSYSSSKQQQGQGRRIAQPNIGFVRSPDPRYLEAFDGYFGDHSSSTSQLEESVAAAMDLQSGVETASEEEEEEEPKVRRAFSNKPVR
jgi:hypothetical protein